MVNQCIEKYMQSLKVVQIAIGNELAEIKDDGAGDQGQDDE